MHESVCWRQSDNNARTAEITAPVVSDLNKHRGVQIMIKPLLKRPADMHSCMCKCTGMSFDNEYCIRLNLKMAAVLWFTMIYCVQT